MPLKDGGVFKTKDKDGNPVELKRGVTAARWTFIIDKNGKVAYKNTKVNAAQDSATVLDAVEKLNK